MYVCVYTVTSNNIHSAHYTLNHREDLMQHYTLVIHVAYNLYLNKLTLYYLYTICLLLKNVVCPYILYNL